MRGRYMERKNKSLTAAAAALIAAEFVTAAASALGAVRPVILFGCAATLLLALYVCISVILKPKGCLLYTSKGSRRGRCNKRQ